jgi:hypothetical protein
VEKAEFYENLYAIDGAIRHEGILGMKWGQRNGPPYPLKKSAYSSAERKAIKKQKRLEKNEKKAEKSQEKADRLKEASAKSREELEAEISNMRLMNDYNRALNESVRLSQEYANLTKKGDSAISKAMKNSATKAVSLSNQRNQNNRPEWG